MPGCVGLDRLQTAFWRTLNKVGVALETGTALDLGVQLCPRGLDVTSGDVLCRNCLGLVLGYNMETSATASSAGFAHGKRCLRDLCARGETGFGRR